MHVNSAGVDWAFNYPVPEQGIEIGLGDLFSRIPDLSKDFVRISANPKYAGVTQITFDYQNGFKAKVNRASFANFEKAYRKLGYEIKSENESSIFTCDAKTFEENSPTLINSYIEKLFNAIPRLFIVEPFNGGFFYSQLCMTYMVSYFLVMLARYYPTHWLSLIRGDKGDAMWPTLNRAQQLVEQSYPELVVEMVLHLLAQSEVEMSEGGA